jgi:hypothetical protein
LLASRRTADDQGSYSDNVSQGIFIINFPTIVVALLSFLALSFAILGWHSVSSAIYGIALGIALLARAAHGVMTVSP